MERLFGRRPGARRLIVFALLLSAVFWFVDSFFDAFVFREGHFFSQALRPSPGEIYFRLLVGTLFVSFALIAHRMMSLRLRSEPAPHVSEAQFRHLVEGSIQGVMIHANHVPLFVNDAFVAILGYGSPEEVLLRSTFDLAAPSDAERLSTMREERLAGRPVPSRYEYQGRRKDGSLVWLECRASVVTWGETTAIQSTVVDISDRKRLEERIRHSQKIEAIGTLASGIAHDFNNILTAILGYTQLTLQDFAKRGEDASNLTKVFEATRRAKRLVEKILTFSRPSESSRGTFEIAPVVQEALSLVRATLPSTVEMRVTIAEDAGSICGDPAQIEQVVLNLCMNAEHALRDAGGIVEVELDPVFLDSNSGPPELAPGSYVRFSVRDSGPGMTREVLEKVFEPFFTTKGVGEGTGMGLAIVHGIVEKHEGAIRVRSEPGAGTTVTVHLPCAEVTVLTEPREAPIDPRGSGRILFVDDEEVLARLGKEMLTRLGYEVVACTSGPEALRIFREEPDRFDLVITDQTMPRMSGESLARAVREIRPGTPMLLCAGFSSVVNEKRAAELGIDAFCMKPLEVEELAAAIHKVLGSPLPATS